MYAKALPFDSLAVAPLIRALRTAPAQIPPQMCSTSTGLWYTCGDLSVPFLGCCLSDACKIDGCPANDLMPAQLSNNVQDAAIFTSIAIASTGSPSMTSMIDSLPASKTSSTTSSTSTPTSSTLVSDSHRGGELSLAFGAKVGIGIGSVAFAVLCVVTSLLARRLYTRRRGQAAKVSKTNGGTEIEQEETTQNSTGCHSFGAPKTSHATDRSGGAVGSTYNRAPTLSHHIPVEWAP